MTPYDALKKFLKFTMPEFILNKIKKEHYYKVLKTFNINDEPDLLIVKEFVAEGDCVIDIGANIGVYTKYLSQFVGSAGKVISIEPIPITYGFLVNNIKKMKLHNVDPYNVAVADKEFVSKMFIPTGDSGENYFRARAVKNDDKVSKKNLRSFDIKFAPLDLLVRSIDRSISFIKIDVEGFELSVLIGAEKTLKKDKPSLLVEIDGNPSNIGSNAENVMKFLRALNYEAYIFNDRKLKIWETGEISVNYFFFNEFHEHLLIDKGILS